MWFLIHESIHRNLHSSAKLNEYGGRILGIMFGASFHILSFGHLMHHKLNRQWESEIYPEGTGLGGKAKYYIKLLFGVYFTEMITSLIMFLMNKRTVSWIAKANDLQEPVETYFYRKERLAKLRTDMLLMTMFFGGAIYAFGTNWPVLAAIILLRAISVSLMDNIFHYDTPADNSVPGKEVRANKLVSWFILNGNFHGTHHSNPKVPWKYLPYAATPQLNPSSRENFCQSLIRQFQGPRINNGLNSM